MTSLFTHVFAAAALAPVCAPRPGWRWTIPAGALAATIPDADVIGFRLGIRYGDFWGHRGFTHSLVFALMLALIGVRLLRRRVPLEPGGRAWLGIYLLLCAASHGVLDAMTNGGRGVGFFMPFENGRHFLPWTPVWVSPLGVENFFTAYGADVFVSELLWVWLPLGALSALCLLARNRMRRRALELTSAARDRSRSH
jgi:inner membrane protein